MKKLLKIVIGIIVVFVCWKAYQATQDNEKSFFSNMGKESKELVEDMKEYQVIDKVKQAGNDIKEGFEE